MTPEQYAAAYLEKHGMIPGYDFVPATVTTVAAQLYTELVDDDLGVILSEDKPAPLPSLYHRGYSDPRDDWFEGEL